MNKPECPECHSTNLKKSGINPAGKQRWRCKDCKKYFVENPQSKNQFIKQKERSVEAIATTLRSYGYEETSNRFGIDKSQIDDLCNKLFSSNAKQPKILLLDIETLYIVAAVWGIYDQTIQTPNILKDSCILSWSAKWLFDSVVMSDVLTKNEAKDRDDSRVLNSIWMLMNDANIIIAHNGDRFDIPKLNASFFIHKMKPPMPFQTIDTYKVAKSIMALTSNKLDYISKLISNKQKIKTDLDLWIRCDRGDQDALDDMIKYNRNDVVLLEEAYLEIRPWMKSAPNLGLYMDVLEPVCRICGSTNLDWCGEYVTPANKYEAYRCNNCGGIGRHAQSILSREQTKQLTRGIPR
jgi:transposase-like protein/predicted RNA-binding Zn-ribbon protein involved in translation (DUF1610 family)